jgi:alkaline phosphatase D
MQNLLLPLPVGPALVAVPPPPENFLTKAARRQAPALPMHRSTRSRSQPQVSGVRQRFASHAALLVFLFAATLLRAELYLAQGVLVGEVTATTAILQTRLTAAPKLDATGDIPGAAGFVRFEISPERNFMGSRFTGWTQARATSDHIVKAFVDGLKPGTTYFYRALYQPTDRNGPSPARANDNSAGSFKTLPAASTAAPVNFVLTSCLNYSFFREGHKGGKNAKGMPAYTGADRELGYPALEPLAKLAPDFVIIDGDCVYYDHPAATAARTQKELRKKWHEQYAMPRFVSLFSRTATYWLKDDHDYRKNDSDPTGDYEPSHDLGIATFREQAPITNPADRNPVTYRTHRIGRDLQLWMVEGRDYRSANNLPDGPAKTIWGAEQRAWLQRTLQESDATFKILISPSPLIGPDDGSKRDNHVNPRGFKHEGETFLAWLKDHGVKPGQFYILSGDRHWKYHSQHATGFEELTCGALNRENSRLGRNPGDPQSTDPEAKVKQFYTDSPMSGGFLQVSVSPSAGGGAARIHFKHYDDRGAVLYEHTRAAP